MVLVTILGLTLLHAVLFVCAVCLLRAHEPALPERATRARSLLQRREEVLLGLHVARVFLIVPLGVVVGRWCAGTSCSFVAVVGVTIGVSLLVMTFTQFSKALVQRNPERSLVWLTPLIGGVVTLVAPIRWLVVRCVAPCIKVCGLEMPTEIDHPVTPEELATLIERSQKAGSIDSSEREIIERVFTASDTVVRQIMTPRKEIITVRESASLDEVVELFLREKISRALVIGAELDQPVGVLLLKDIFAASRRELFSVKALARPVRFVPNSKKVDEMLEEFRTSRSHLAVVIEEDGTVDGIVTLEDVVEEIVGEIHDEYDDPQKEELVRKTKSGDLIVAGQVRIAELPEELQRLFPAPDQLGVDFDTVGGFVVSQLGRLPTVGEIVALAGKAKVIVDGVSPVRVLSVRLHLPPQPAGQGKG